MERVRNQRWVEYGTTTMVPHGIGRELLLRHNLPDIGYHKSRRKQLNRYWGTIYKALSSSVVDAPLIEQLFQEAKEGGPIEFGEEEQYELGRLFGRAIITGGYPVAAFDPNDVYPDLCEGTAVLAVECHNLDPDILDPALDEGFVLLPEGEIVTVGMVELLGDIAARGLPEDACILVLTQADVGDGYERWELRMGAVPFFKQRINLGLKRQSNAQLTKLATFLNEQITAMVKLAATPWERTRRRRKPGQVGGLAAIPAAEVETLLQQQQLEPEIIERRLREHRKLRRGYDPERIASRW
jgi:hypothetical protein